MILRRFMKHVTDQNWFAVGLDVLVVITGIFLGMQVTEWNEERKEKSLSVMYQQNLLSDLINDVASLNTRIDYLSAAITYGYQAQYLLENYDGHTENPIGGVIKFFGPSNRWAYNSNQPTFDELQSSGRLDLIGDKSVRDSIITLYARRKNAKELGNYSFSYRRLIRGIVPVTMSKKIVDSCDVFSEDKNGITVGLMKLDCSIETDEKRAAIVLHKIVNHPDTEHSLNLQMSSMITHQKSLHNLLAATNKRIIVLKGLIEEVAIK